jgi:hypothetical protein
MRGSIRKRGSTYTYWLDLPPDPVTGKRRQRTKGGFRTKRECQAALNAAIMAVQTGTYVEASRRTVRSFLLDEWLPDWQPPRLRATTYANYQTQIKTHVVPGLGSVALQRLSPPSSTASTGRCWPTVAVMVTAWRRRLEEHPRDPASSAQRRSPLGLCGP